MASDTQRTGKATARQGGSSSSMAPASTWKPQSKQQAATLQRRKIIHIALAAVLVVGYACAALYFSNHFTPGTSVDGVDAGKMTAEELAKAIDDRAASYSLHITDENGFDVTIDGSDMGITADGTQVAKEAMERNNPLLWLPYLLSPQHMLIDAHVTTDENALKSTVAAAVKSYNDKAEAPTNATGAYDKKAKKFVVVPEKVGTALDADKVAEVCEVSSRELLEQVTLDEDTLAQPAVGSDDKTLKASVKQANKIIKNEIDVVCDDEVVSTVDRATLISWMHFDDEQKLDIYGVGDWVASNDAIQEIGNTEDDAAVWELDFQGTVDDIHRVMKEDLGDDAQVVREAIFTKPAVTPGAKQRGRHIDINLSTQYVRFYDTDGTVIWESYCVTGGYDPVFGQMHYTPTGEFAIQAKETGRTLVGADSNMDGQPDYESYVYYWMPFLNYDYGLHDATWRGEFGGDIYTWWGSHGCINLPYDKAEELFNLVNVGDPVVIHD